MAEHPEISHLDRDERIRRIAYAIWDEEGHPEGCAEDHWLRACALVDAEADLAAADVAEETRNPDWLKRNEAQPAEQSKTLSDVVRKVASARAA